MEHITQNQTTNPQTKKRRGIVRRYSSALLVVLVLALAVTSIYFYKKSTTNPNAATQAEVQSLVQKVGRLVVLPTDETPTVATVSDPAALKDQPFFADAKKGDKVLIYSNAKKAILYDPVLDKVITIAPLNIDAKAAPAPSPVLEQPKTTKKN